ncbi:hypothetical protein SEA_SUNSETPOINTE_44 [Streptomyces phage SunsetPointe]|nr:hypothetical protein SEA_SUNSETPOINTE_44 [Streptomyces phage SunsetPointe]
MEFIEIPDNEYRSAEGARLDWSFASDPEFMANVPSRVAKNVSFSYGHTVDYDDAFQEACLIIAANPGRRRECEDGIDGATLGTLVYEVQQDVIDKIKRTAEKRTRHLSYEDAIERTELGKQTRREATRPLDLRESLEESERARTPQAPVSYGPQPRAKSGGGYDRRLVETLLPTVWDGAAVYGLKNDQAPDPDMPKAATNPKESNTLWAHLIDIRTAWNWAKNTLPLAELQVVFMRYGLDRKVEDIAEFQGVNKGTVSRRAERAVGKITAHLNGVPYVDGYDNDNTEEVAA